MAEAAQIITTAKEIREKGFSIIQGIYTDKEIQKILSVIESADSSSETFRKSTGLFAIRRFLEEIPDVLPIVFNANLLGIITDVLGKGYFIVKSIYFDKPGESNWFVAYHQDLTISVREKTNTEGFGPWTVKQRQFAVQPPNNYLEDIFTVRVHLDEANQFNGALKVINGSHTKGIYRPETIDRNIETETICNVPKGGIMLMKPLLLHSSGRTTNNAQRRVIHIELSSKELPDGMEWSEKMNLPC
ncbi:phytanoyl-CoA dioxygenase family protein [Flavobacterium sp. MFBS3-15]|uniref:phytanoyl-CoA dioxygenase family protein n=1 Tax=Flavobacterium sp. MFBS3-15 TaxID=2989816 RepID=UPI0022369F98|nr:phytanoyl-CoA dioxygenase family protein [Flavobacterium sp. MFBS3-15]MCW4470104.1 phytanoyl-CoA dioxygenase family protein [Flavobacterium sp. MFBS3-15]